MKSIIKSWSQEGHPVNGTKQNCQITGCRLTSGIRSTLPSGVVLFGLCSLLTSNAKDDDDEIVYFIQNPHIMIVLIIS